MAKNRLRKLISSIFSPWPHICQKLPQEAHFEYFQPLAAHMPKNSLRKLILSIFSPWPHILPKVISGSSFWVFSSLGRTYGQKLPQEAHFEHFQPLAAHMAKSSLRKLILNIFSSWLHIWPKVVSGSSFWVFSTPGRTYDQKLFQEPNITKSCKILPNPSFAVGFAGGSNPSKILAKLAKSCLILPNPVKYI